MAISKRLDIRIDDETDIQLDRLAGLLLTDRSKVIRLAVAMLAAQHEVPPVDPLNAIERHLRAAMGVIQREWAREDLRD